MTLIHPLCGLEGPPSSHFLFEKPLNVQQERFGFVDCPINWRVTSWKRPPVLCLWVTGSIWRKTSCSPTSARLSFIFCGRLSFAQITLRLICIDHLSCITVPQLICLGFYSHVELWWLVWLCKKATPHERLCAGVCFSPLRFKKGCRTSNKET